jgi:hypothetical protein
MSSFDERRRKRKFFSSDPQGTITHNTQTDFEKQALTFLLAIIVTTATITWGIINKHYSIIMGGFIVIIVLIVFFVRVIIQS